MAKWFTGRRADTGHTVNSFRGRSEWTFLDEGQKSWYGKYTIHSPCCPEGKLTSEFGYIKTSENTHTHTLGKEVKIEVTFESVCDCTWVPADLHEPPLRCVPLCASAK